MAGIFEDYTIAWHGMDHVIPAGSMLRVIASVEDVVTYGELLGFARRRTAPFAKLAQAYGIVLRAAGVAISDDDVYAGMFGIDISADMILDAINGLFGLMLPPSERGGENEGGEPDPGNARKRAPAKASSKPSIKRSSARAG